MLRHALWLPILLVACAPAEPKVHVSIDQAALVSPGFAMEVTTEWASYDSKSNIGTTDRHAAEIQCGGVRCEVTHVGADSEDEIREVYRVRAMETGTMTVDIALENLDSNDTYAQKLVHEVVTIDDVQMTIRDVEDNVLESGSTITIAPSFDVANLYVNLAATSEQRPVNFASHMEIGGQPANREYCHEYAGYHDCLFEAPVGTFSFRATVADRTLEARYELVR